jgi:fused signal recognition particle receptor
MGMFERLGLSKLKEGLAKTREGLVGKVLRLASGKGPIDEELLSHVEEALIAGDVGVHTTAAIIDGIRERAREEERDSTSLIALLKEEVERQLQGSSSGVREDSPPVSDAVPHVIMVVGINGVGKTTTIGKLAYRLVQSGKRVTIAAADTFRAAANEQIAIWAKRAGAAIIRQQHGADPAAVAFDAVHSASVHGTDVVIIDTAGRLHTKVNLMEELRKIRRVLQKQNTAAPHEVLLVIDASTGQNGLQQARQFTSAVGVTGIVLTKLDGTAKGGVVLAITRELNIPVRYVGVGEQIDDLQPFDTKAFVDALFDQSEGVR